LTRNLPHPGTHRGSSLQVINVIFILDVCHYQIMSEDQKDRRLTEFLENGKDWERKQTNIPGVFLIRLPQFRSRPACVGVELDVLNRGGGGNRRRGIILRTKEELQQLSEIITNNKLIQLTSAIEKVNPVQQATMGANLDNEIFEI
jgi:hypothetical protein